MSRRGAVLFLLAAAGYADESEIAARTAWGEARLALEKRDPRALAKFEEALKGLPSDPLLLYETAMCAFDLGALEKAETWVVLVTRTEDAAFKKRPEYQDAFTLWARVREAREVKAEIGPYAKAIEVMCAAVASTGGVGSLEGFLTRSFEKNVQSEKTRYGMVAPVHPLAKALSQPGFTGRAESILGKPHSSCSFALEDLTTERAATAIFRALAEAGAKEQPHWERWVGDRPPEAQARLLFESVPSKERVSAWDRSEARPVAWVSYEVELLHTTPGTPRLGPLGKGGQVKDVPPETRPIRWSCFAIAMEAYVPKGKEAERFRVVLRVSELAH